MLPLVTVALPVRLGDENLDGLPDEFAVRVAEQGLRSLIGNTDIAQVV